MAAKAATMRKTPNETKVMASDAVRPRMMVTIRSTAAMYSVALRNAGDLTNGYVWF